MKLYTTAEYYNRLKLEGLIINHSTEHGWFLPFDCAVQNKNKTAMPDGVLMMLAENESI